MKFPKHILILILLINNIVLRKFKTNANWVKEHTRVKCQTQETTDIGFKYDIPSDGTWSRNELKIASDGKINCKIVWYKSGYNTIGVSCFGSFTQTGGEGVGSCHCNLTNDLTFFSNFVLSDTNGNTKRVESCYKIELWNY